MYQQSDIMREPYCLDLVFLIGIVLLVAFLLLLLSSIISWLVCRWVSDVGCRNADIPSRGSLLTPHSECPPFYADFWDFRLFSPPFLPDAVHSPQMSRSRFIRGVLCPLHSIRLKLSPSRAETSRQSRCTTRPHRP